MADIVSGNSILARPYAGMDQGCLKASVTGLERCIIYAIQADTGLYVRFARSFLNTASIAWITFFCWFALQ